MISLSLVYGASFNLKNEILQEYFESERKGVDSRQIRNFAWYFISSNHKVPIKLVYDIQKRIENNQYKLKFCPLGTIIPNDIILW